MGSAYLKDYIENAEFYLKKMIPALTRGELDRRGIQEMCTAFRQRGLCSLLLYGVGEPFYLNMMESGGAFLYYLQGAADEHKVTSQVKPFFDTIGGGFWDCAKAIAHHSRMTWNRDYEYDDDFLYVLFLMKHFFLEASDEECETIISLHGKVSEGADEERRDICKAFLTTDNDLFEEKIHYLLEQRAEQVEKMIARDALPEEVWAWLRYFSSEGLALLRLAERKGFNIEEVYLHIPASVRPESPFSFNPDAWRNLNYGQ